MADNRYSQRRSPFGLDDDLPASVEAPTVCADCGVTVVDAGAHDRHHDVLDQMAKSVEDHFSDLEGRSKTGADPLAYLEGSLDDFGALLCDRMGGHDFPTHGKTLEDFRCRRCHIGVTDLPKGGE